MPTPMVHLLVAKNCVASGYQVKDLPQFYLGAISPDAIHMRQGANRLAKNVTHLIPSGITSWFDIDQNEYLTFMNGYIAANKSNVNADFILGYAIHVLTDMHWTYTVHSKFAEDYNNSEKPIEERAKAYYYDMDIHEYALYCKYFQNSDIWQNLQNPDYSDFLDMLTSEEIKLWNERVQSWCDNPENQHKFEDEPKYISALDIEKFISSCAELIVSNMNVLKLDED